MQQEVRLLREHKRAVETHALRRVSVTTADARTTNAVHPDGAGPDDRPPTREELQRRYIVRALEECGWVVEGPRGAATMLELHPNTLRSRVKNLGIRRGVM